MVKGNHCSVNSCAGIPVLEAENTNTGEVVGAAIGRGLSPRRAPSKPGLGARLD